MRRTELTRRTLLAGTALVALAMIPNLQGGEIRPWREKVHPLVLERAATGPVEFMVVLGEQADLREAGSFQTKVERGQWVVSQLRALAERTQAPLVEQLTATGVEHRPFWIANMIWVRGGENTVEAMALAPEVRRIDANPVISWTPPERQSGSETESTATIEWGIQKVAANQLWALGYRGQGVVVAGQDTGIEWAHPAIKNQYRGWNGSTANHNYNWHDSIHSGGGTCGANTTAPCDDHDHGTHTMGTMVGDDGGANQIGMAPEAKWIGCRNMNVGNGTPATYSECFQWLIAPTNSAGLSPDPSKSPDVINNSWTCPIEEGCAFDTLQTVVQNTRAAGILVVASAGNSGSDCSTVSDPPAIYGASLSVGATDINDSIASFSSRGPVTVDGSNRLKPDLSAPGVNVRSCVRGGGYASLSGTSMAGPHVVGMAALLMSARPDLKGQVDTLETLLELSSLPRTSAQTCGGIPGTTIPNPIFGYGRIDGVETILGDTDQDGVSNLADCKPLEGSLWSAPGAAAGLLMDQTGGVTSLAWDAPQVPGGTAVHYDVVRSTQGDNFSTAKCLLTNSTATSTADSQLPGEVFYYLVRVKNGCGSSLGAGSNGVPRTARTCLSSGG